MILVSFAFAFGFFIIASNYFPRFWHWLVSGVVSFALTYLAFTSGIDALIYVVVGVFVLLLIVTLIKNHLE